MCNMQNIYIGTFILFNKDGKRLIAIGIGGNSKQRRTIIRKWKKMGYVAKYSMNCN